MYEGVRVEFYMPLFYGLFYVFLLFFAYSVVYLRQKRRLATKKEHTIDRSEK